MLKPKVIHRKIKKYLKLKINSLTVTKTKIKILNKLTTYLWQIFGKGIWYDKINQVGTI